MSKTTAIWRTEPLDVIILEILSSKGGTITDKNLYDAVRTLRPDLSMNEFNKALLRLEIKGYISVATVKKNLRNVILLSRAAEEKRKG